MRKLLFLIVLMILPHAAMADNAKTTKTLTYNFTGVSNDGLVSNNSWGGDDGVFWTYVSGFHFWSTGASAIGARCIYNSYVYTRSKETFPEVIQKVTVKAGAWSDVSTGLKLNNKEVKLKTISTNAYQGIESRIQFDDYVFENVSTSDDNGHLLLEYVLSGEADIFIRSITIEYVEGGECDMSEIPTDNDFYAATSFLCEREILDGSKDDGKYSVEEKLLRKHLANITFRGLFTLNGREIPSTFVSDQYPAVYEDLKSDASYYQAAKTLLYLDYSDGITPFDRDRDGFFPDYSESRINVLKELMEAFNIKPDTEGKNNPFPNDPGIAELAETSPIRMGYVRQAAKLGIITTEHTAFYPHRECLRGEAFLMLARIIQKIEAGEIADPNPQESDFLDPNSGTGTAEPYAVLSNNNTVLTFYYDGLKAKRNGMDVGPFNIYPHNPSWYGQRKSITSVVFDASFAYCTTLTCTAYWFKELQNLSSITGISNLKTGKVTNMYQMFEGCKSLKSLDVSGFNTANVTRMYRMFGECESLTSLDVSHFNTDNVTDMGDMFYGCSGLKSLDVSHFNTANVTDMNDMFNSCRGLTSLDVSGFVTDKVTDMSCMFVACSGLKSLDVSGFNTAKVTNMEAMFNGCSGLQNLNLSNFNTANVTNMYSMFASCSGLTSLDLSGFKTDKVTDMAWMFSGCSGLKSLNLSNFNTAKVTKMISMFGWCSNLTSLDLSGFDTNNVTDMSNMFGNCSGLTSLDVSGFKNEKVTNMDNMFSGCSSLTSIDLSGFKTDNVTGMFNMFGGCLGLTSLDLSSFKTSNATGIMWMFDNCSNLKTIYAGDGWNISKDKSSPNVFRDCTSLVGGAGTHYDANHTDNTYARIDGGPNSATPGYFTYKSAPAVIEPEPYAVLSDNNTVLTFYYDGQKTKRNGMDVGPFNTSPYHPSWYGQRESITSVVFKPSFSNCTTLTSTAFWFRDLKNLSSITGIGNLKTDNVTSMRWMFYGCSSLKSLDVKGFNTANVTKMENMFYGCSGLTSLDVKGFNTANVTDMESLFDGCSGLTSLDVTGFNTQKVKYMSSMFSGCSGLTSLDVTGFKTDNVTDIGGMFYGCSGLTSLDVTGFKTDNVTSMGHMFGNCSGLTNLDVTGFNTQNVTSMYFMFGGCSSLTNLDVTGFKTDNVTNMKGMFYGCSGLTSLDVTGLKTNKVTDINMMFDSCSGLTSLDLTGFKTDKVTDMGFMFYGCSGLKAICTGDGWSTANVNESWGMFTGCSKLVGGAGTTYDANHTNHTYAHIDGGTANPGYFTVKPEGDLNGDGKVDAADIVVLVSVRMGGKMYKFADADLNHDEKVDDADVVTLVNKIMSQKKDTQH